MKRTPATTYESAGTHESHDFHFPLDPDGDVRCDACDCRYGLTASRQPCPYARRCDACDRLGSGPGWMRDTVGFPGDPDPDSYDWCPDCAEPDPATYWDDRP